MISKAKLKELAVYKQQKRCDEDQLFVVEGIKMCDEVLAANLPVRCLCATNSWLERHPLPAMCDNVFEVNAEELERISSMRTPNEAWMLLDREAVRSAASLAAPAVPLTLALDRLQDPGNLGTIIRTADWFGIRRIVCSPDTASCFNPKVVQATMGGLFRTQMLYTPLPQWLAQCGMPVFGAMLDGSSIWNPDSRIALPAEGAVLVVGNESRGISPEVQALLTHRVKIPNLGGTAESLNASVATAILCAELLRG